METVFMLLCIFLYFDSRTLCVVHMPALLFILRFRAVVVKGGPVYITVPLGQRWMVLRWNLAEPPSVNERAPASCSPSVTRRGMRRFRSVHLPLAFHVG